MARPLRFDWQSSDKARRPATPHRPLAPFFHRLRIEPLEDRRLLASVVVSNNLDLINGDTSSIANLIAGDGGDGISLREAIQAANATAGPDEITFAAAASGATITLGGTELVISEALTIDARPLAANVTIHANQLSRIFNIRATTGNFTLGGLTLSGGSVLRGSSVERGGAILSITSGNLTLDQSTVSGNAAYGSGGGIAANGTVTLTQSTVSGNSTPAHGGGIYAGRVTLTQSTVSGNSTAGDIAAGGGIFAYGPVTLTQSTVSGNSTAGNGAWGGGIYAGTVTLIQSTVSGNRTAGNGAGGGGIRTIGSVTLTQSTVSGNSTAGIGAHGGGIAASGLTLTESTVSGNSTVGINAYGGGIHAGTVTLTQSTVTDNRAMYATAMGGGVFQVNSFLDHAFSISGSIVADNTAGGGGADLVKDPGSTLTVNYSLIGTGITPTAGGNNVVDDNPQLGPLTDNGGPTMTHALLAGSLAIDAGDPAALAGVGGVPEFDQRGMPFTRVFDGDGASGARIDIGAFEVQQVIIGPELPGDYNLTGVVDAADYTVWSDTRGATVTPFDGADGNGDGTVDDDDYDVWKTNFANTLPLTASASTIATPPRGPESTSASLLIPLPHAIQAPGAKTSGEPPSSSATLEVLHTAELTNTEVLVAPPPADISTSRRVLSRRSAIASAPSALARQDDALLAWLQLRFVEKLFGRIAEIDDDLFDKTPREFESPASESLDLAFATLAASAR